MSEDTAPIVVTLKAGTGYDAPWLVIRGYDPADVTAKLEGLDPVIEATLTAAGKFAASRSLGATVVATEPAQQQPKQQGWGQTPAAAQQGAAPQQNGPKLHPTDTCQQCGSRVQEKDVFRKSDGKKFEFWSCPNQRQRNDGHYNEFRN